MTIRFSVLIPTHNESDLLRLAIRSVLAQTFPDFEILVVADGCTDRTQDAVREFADPRVRLFDLPKAPGFGYANRNVALREARGELIAFLAHDDLYLRDHLEIMDRVFDDESIHWSCSRSVVVEPDGMCRPSSRNLDVPSLLKAFVEKKFTVPACSVVHRRTCLVRFGYWDETLLQAGDRDLWSRFVDGVGWHGIRFVSIPTSLHFRASWRENMRDETWRVRLARTSYPDPWPLQFEIPAGETEQSAFLALMEADPDRWPGKFRRGAQAILDGSLHTLEFERNSRTKAGIARWRERNRPESGTASESGSRSAPWDNESKS